MEEKKKETAVSMRMVAISVIVMFVAGALLGYTAGHRVGYSEGALTGIVAGNVQGASIASNALQDQEDCFACGGKLYKKEAGVKTYENGTIEPVYTTACDCNKV